jgi:Zn-dependent M16 (insulinase) family peptidase
MLTTTIFRLQQSESQIPLLNEISVVYNRMKRKGCNLLFNGASQKAIQRALMGICQNNSHVNTILTENQTKLAQQKTWLKKRADYLTHKLAVVEQQFISFYNFLEGYSLKPSLVNYPRLKAWPSREALVHQTPFEETQATMERLRHLRLTHQTVALSPMAKSSEGRSGGIGVKSLSIIVEVKSDSLLGHRVGIRTTQ